MSSSGSLSNDNKTNDNETIDKNKMERMMDYLAFTVNEKGRNMVENLSKIREEMKNTTKKILKEKISIKSRVRTGGEANYMNLTSLENQYNTLLGEYNKALTEMKQERESLVKGGMEIINKTEEPIPKKKKRKRRRKRNKKNSEK